MQAMLAYSRAEGDVMTIGLAVAFYAQPATNLAWPKNAELAKWGFGPRTIQRRLRELELLGELRRVPEHETAERSRVYLVDPKSARQMSFEDLAGGVPQTPGGASVGRGVSLTRVSEGVRGDSHARTCKEPTEPINDNTPPNPPTGGSAPDLLDQLQQPSQLPRVTSATASETPARRRRRRRAATGDAHSSEPSEPCPLRQATDSEATDIELLRDVWDPLVRELEAALGGQWEIWGADAHLHGIRDGALVVALRPPLVQFAAARFGRVLARAAKRDLQLVGCAALEAIRP